MAGYRDSVNEVFSLIKTQWALANWSHFGAAPAIKWQNDDEGGPGTATPFARVAMIHTDGGQASLSDEDGNRAFEHSGTLFVQCFAPDKGRRGFDDAQRIAEVAKGILQGKRTSNVIFRRVRLEELGADGSGFFQVNVLADFEWYERG